GFAAPEIESRVLRAANAFGLGSLLNRKPRELSGGQQQRVALGRAIVKDPLVFLFDEPLSSIDAKLRPEPRVDLKRVARGLERSWGSGPRLSACACRRASLPLT